MFIQLLRVFSIICVALVMGNLVKKVKLPAILGWLTAGIIFGPYLAEVVTFEITDSLWYKIFVKIFECFAGVMLGKELIFKKIAKSGKQIMGITVIQSVATFLFVSLVFSIVFIITDIPVYMAFIFGGIALATAPAPALSIVNEYHTSGPVTDTLIPLAIIDDVIGIIIFFSVITTVNVTMGSAAASPLMVLGIIFLPVIIGALTGIIAALIIKKINNTAAGFITFIFFLCLCAFSGILTDKFIFHSFSMNYFLTGISFSTAVSNMVSEEKFNRYMDIYSPILNISMVIVIISLGIPLDYKLIAGAGLFTAIYIVSRAVGKTGGAYLGGVITKSPPTVKKYLGLTLLPHSGVSLVFTGIAATSLTAIDPSLASVITGTIAAAAIINEIIAVLLAKIAFKKAGEIKASPKTPQQIQ